MISDINYRLGSKQIVVTAHDYLFWGCDGPSTICSGGVTLGPKKIRFARRRRAIEEGRRLAAEMSRSARKM